MVAWSVRALDGVPSADPERVLARVERGLRDGAIVLLHDAAERDDYEPVAVGLLPRILERMGQRGLRGVTVSEILRDGAAADVRAGPSDEPPLPLPPEPSRTARPGQ